MLAPTEYGCYSLPARESVGGREWECVGVCRCLSATVAAMVCVCSCLCVSPSVRVCYGVRVRVCSCLSRCSCVCWLLLSMCAKVGCPAMCVCVLCRCEGVYCCKCASVKMHSPQARKHLKNRVHHRRTSLVWKTRLSKVYSSSITHCEELLLLPDEGTQS